MAIRAKNEATFATDSMASFLLRWTCSRRSLLGCVRDLIESLSRSNYMANSHVQLVEHWISDLRKLHYLEPPVIGTPGRRGYMNPCLGADGLVGVSFYPALAPKSLSSEQSARRDATLGRYLREEALLGVPPSSVGSAGSLGNPSLVDSPPIQESAPRHARHAQSDDDEMPLVREFTNATCAGYSPLVPHRCKRPHDNVLLIVTMTTSRYDMIPFFEVIYRHQFRNILYCGNADESIQIFLRKYQMSEDRSFSFLPSRTKNTYECVLGALEMGYNVDGYITTTDDTLINSWNLERWNVSQPWYSGDYNIKLSSQVWKALDPGSQKLPRSLEGVLKVLEFLKTSVTVADHHNDQRANHKVWKRDAENDTMDGAIIDRLQKRGAALIQSSIVNSPLGFQTEDFVLHEYKASQVDTKAASGEISIQGIDSNQGSSNEAANLTQQLLMDVVQLQPQSRKLPSLQYHVSNATDSDEVVVGAIDDQQPELTVYSFDADADVEASEEVQEQDADESSEERAEVLQTSEVLHKLKIMRTTAANDTAIEAAPKEASSTTTSASQVHDSTTSSDTALHSDHNVHDAKTSTPSQDQLSDVTKDPPIDDPPIKDVIEYVHDHPAKEHPVSHNPVLDLFLHPPVAPVVVTEPPPAPETAATDYATDSVVDKESTGEQVHQTQDIPSDPIVVVPAVEEKRSQTDMAVDETLTNLSEIYRSIRDNLRAPADSPSVTGVDVALYGGDRSPYRLDPKNIHHFHCEKGTSMEFCKVSSQFLSQLTDNMGDELQLIYDKVPMYFIPTKDQLKFYLLSNLMLQNGVTDEIAIPLILSGLRSQDEWLKLDKSYFGALRTSADQLVANRYPLFNSAAAVLYPTDLNTIMTDSKVQKVFCLKYLLRVLQL